MNTQVESRAQEECYYEFWPKTNGSLFTVEDMIGIKESKQ